MRLPSFSLTTKIFSLVILLLILLCIMAGIAIMKMNSINQELQSIVKQNLPLMAEVTDLKINKLEQTIYFERVFNEKNKVKLQTLIHDFAKFSNSVRDNIDKVQKFIDESLEYNNSISAELGKFREQVVNLRKQQDLYENKANEIIQKLEKGELVEFETVAMRDDIIELQVQLTEDLNDFLNKIQFFNKQSSSQAEQQQTSASNWLWMIIILALLSGILLASLFSRHLSYQIGGEPDLIRQLAEKVALGDLSIFFKESALHQKLKKHPTGIYASIELLVESLNEVVNKATRLASGDYSVKIVPRSDRDMLGIALEQLTDRLFEITNISKAIAEGDYNRQIATCGETDMLGYAINQMTQRLREVTEETRRSDWIKTGQTELNECMRGEQDPYLLMQNVLNFLAEYIEVPVAVFYLAQSDDTLRLARTYAFWQRNHNYNVFKIGEGLVGQAALERKSILFKHLPPEHIPLSLVSGVGESKPSCIFVLPLLLEDKLLGVIEFGSLKEFSDTSRELLERVAENIAIALHTALSRLEMHALLEESQKLTQELQNQQDEISEREERIRTIVDTVVDAIITIDEQGIIKSFNKAAETIFGYSRMEVSGQNVKLLMPEPYISEHDQYLRSYMSTGHARIIGNPREVTGRRKDGSMFPIDLAVNEMQLRGKRLFTGIIRDITERKHAQEIVRQQQEQIANSEARLRTIMDTVVDAIITIDENGLIESFNRAAERLFGYSAPEMLGENISLLMPEPYNKQHDGYLKHYLTTNEPRVVGTVRELVGRRKDGSIFPLDLAVDQMRMGDRLLFTGIIRDITDRKKAAEELRIRQEELQTQNEEMQAQNEEMQAQNEELQMQQAELKAQQEELRHINEMLAFRTHELEQQRGRLREINAILEQKQQELEIKAKEVEQASQYKSQFLAIMSHELRTPLNSMLILAQSLSENRTHNLSDKQIEYARTIYSAGTDLLSLINEILDLSKIEAGKMEISVETFSVVELLDNMERKFQHLAEQKGLKFTLELNEHIPATLENDQQRLTQILNNLLSNALKFTSKGQIILRLELAEEIPELFRGNITYISSPPYLIFHVTDTGTGIPVEKIELVFEAFRQADSTISRRFGGTGLGLSISRKLSRLLGGELVVSSVLNEGSTFSLLLPLQAPVRSIEESTELLTQSSLVLPPAMTAEINRKAAIVPIAEIEQINNSFSDSSNITLLEKSVEFATKVENVVQSQALKESTQPPSATFTKPEIITTDKNQISNLKSIVEKVAASTQPEIPHHTPTTSPYRHRHLMPNVSRARRSQGAPVPFLMIATPPPPLPDDRDNLQPEDKKLLIIDDDHNFLRIMQDLAHDHHFQCLVAEDGMAGLLLAEEYRPTAIILDVGLPKVNGWSVMESLKDSPNTRHIPVHFISAHDDSAAALRMGAIGYSVKPVRLEELNATLQNIETFIERKLKTLLLMTDRPERQQALSNVVNLVDVTLDSVNSLEEAMQQLTETKIDCVVIDIESASNSGIHLLETMHTQARLLAIPIVLYGERELTTEEADVLQHHQDMTVKTVHSPERLLDEVTLFLHQLETELPQEQQRMLRMVRDKEVLLANKTVLIVDDDVRNTFALTTFLEGRDMKVTIAKNGKEALDILDQQPEIAIVLMDIMMPEMDGYEAMQRIRSQARFQKLPIIALTAKAMKGDKARCIEAGASDYLTKPVDTDKLISVMRVWLYQ